MRQLRTLRRWFLHQLIICFLHFLTLGHALMLHLRTFCYQRRSSRSSSNFRNFNSRCLIRIVQQRFTIQRVLQGKHSENLKSSFYYMIEVQPSCLSVIFYFLDSHAFFEALSWQCLQHFSWNYLLSFLNCLSYLMVMILQLLYHSSQIVSSILYLEQKCLIVALRILFCSWVS